MISSQASVKGSGPLANRSWHYMMRIMIAARKLQIYLKNQIKILITYACGSSLSSSSSSSSSSISSRCPVPRPGWRHQPPLSHGRSPYHMQSPEYTRYTTCEPQKFIQFDLQMSSIITNVADYKNTSVPDADTPWFPSLYQHGAVSLPSQWGQPCTSQRHTSTESTSP